MTPPLKHADARKLRQAALKYPQTVEDFPWDHHAYKVAGKKAFLFLTGLDGGGFDCTMKLPYRCEEALALKGARPAGYGLGASGWVTFVFGPKARPPMARLVDYLDESWRAVAPKRFSEAQPQPPAPKRRGAS
jgi:predicted DNA-binding protein (MmcQ/YjbR family)